jgi:hypothetical protein
VYICEHPLEPTTKQGKNKMKNQVAVTSDKTISAQGIQVTLLAKDHLAYLQYLINEIQDTSSWLNMPYDATHTTTVAENIIMARKPKDFKEYNLTPSEIKDEVRNKKRIKRIVKIVVRDIEDNHGRNFGDKKGTVEYVVDDIYNNTCGGEDLTVSQILAIAYALLDANDLIKADSYTNIKPDNQEA